MTSIFRLHNIDEILGVDEPDDDGGGAAVAIARDSGGATKGIMLVNNGLNYFLIICAKTRALS